MTDGFLPWMNLPSHCPMGETAVAVLIFVNCNVGNLSSINSAFVVSGEQSINQSINF